MLAGSSIGEKPRLVLTANLAEAQQSLFPIPITTSMPLSPVGKDLSRICGTPRGMFWCKSDKDDRPIRATEWILSRLAYDLGIPVPDFAEILDTETGESYFGSLHVGSTLDRSEIAAHLNRRRVNELGAPDNWLRSYLARLYGFDMLTGNVDRGFSNFLLSRDGAANRILAMDFASANLLALEELTFPVAPVPTVTVGRHLRRLHGFALADVNGFVERACGYPPSAFTNLVQSVPDAWLKTGQRDRLCKLWMGSRMCSRLAALESGLRDGSLL